MGAGYIVSIWTKNFGFSLCLSGPAGSCTAVVDHHVFSRVSAPEETQAGNSWLLSSRRKAKRGQLSFNVKLEWRLALSFKLSLIPGRAILPHTQQWFSSWPRCPRWGNIFSHITCILLYYKYFYWLAWISFKGIWPTSKHKRGMCCYMYDNR